MLTKNLDKRDQFTGMTGKGSRSGLQVASTKDILYSVIFFFLGLDLGLSVS